MFNFNTNRRSVEPSFGGSAAAPAAAAQSKKQVTAQTAPTQAMTTAGTQMTEQDAYMNARIEEIEAQRIEFMRKNPEFDMQLEMENPKFAEYVLLMGLSVEDAYFLVHRDEIIDDAVNSALERIASRRSRIVENGAGKNSPAAVKKNPKDLSDSEIDDIIERVRSGEKVSF